MQSSLRFRGVGFSDGRLLLLCLGIGFAVRLVPEVLAWPLPIGYDTVYYAVVMKSGVVWAHWSQFFTSSWLLYALIVPAYGVVQGDPFLLLKFAGPLLFGLNVAGVYWFSRRALGWSLRMSLVAAVFFALQLASLRISWDLLRNTLGLGVLLFALSYSKDVGSWRGFALFAGLSLLSVFAHEYAAVLLVAAVLGLVAVGLVRKESGLGVRRLVLASFPALAVFAVGMWLRFFPIRYAAPETNVITVGDVNYGSAGGLFFMTNYLQVQTPVDACATYFDLAFTVAVFFAVLYLPYLFLVVKGFFRNGILDAWTALMLVGGFGCLIVPFFALQYWHRWMFMLVLPFTFYAVSGLRRLVGKYREKGLGFFRLLSSKKCAAMVLLTFAIGVSYLPTPIILATTGASMPYIPSISTYFSVAPTVPYEDADSVVESMEWLDANMGAASCVALQHDFLPWGQLYLDGSHEIVYFTNSFDRAVEAASDNGFESLFLVWWNQPIGWDRAPVPDGFVSVRDFGRISVYVNEV